MLTVTGTDRYYGQPDQGSIFNMIRERADIVTIKPLVLHLPLRRTEKSRFRREVHQVLYDSALPLILAEIKRLVDEEDEEAVHLFTVAGDFTLAQVQEIQRHAQMLHKRGRIQVLVNRLIPASRNNATAEVYLADFVMAKGQPKVLVNLAGSEDFAPLPQGTNGMCRDELVECLGGTNGISVPQKVEQAIQRIVELRGR